VRIPRELVPKDASVEMDAKVAAGYYTDSVRPGPAELAVAKGRALVSAVASVAIGATTLASTALSSGVLPPEGALPTDGLLPDEER